MNAREHTDAVIAALEAADLSVGDGEAPTGSPPFCVVYKVPGGSRSGTLASPFEDAQLVYQVTCVGTTREQAEWVADKAEVLLNGLQVNGRYIALVSPEVPAGVNRDDTDSPPLYYATPRYRLTSHPA